LKYILEKPNGFRSRFVLVLISVPIRFSKASIKKSKLNWIIIFGQLYESFNEQKLIDIRMGKEIQLWERDIVFEECPWIKLKKTIDDIEHHER
jgi:hypothetical protein